MGPANPIGVGGQVTVSPVKAWGQVSPAVQARESATPTGEPKKLGAPTVSPSSGPAPAPSAPLRGTKRSIYGPYPTSAGVPDVFSKEKVALGLLPRSASAGTSREPPGTGAACTLGARSNRKAKISPAAPRILCGEKNATCRLFMAIPFSKTCWITGPYKCGGGCTGP